MWFLSHAGSWPLHAAEYTFLALRDHYGRVPGCDKTIVASPGARGVWRVFFLSSEVRRSRQAGLALLTDEELVRTFLTATDRIVRDFQDFWTHNGQRNFSAGKAPELVKLFRSNNDLLKSLFAHYQLSSSEFSAKALGEIRQGLRRRAFDSNDVLNCLTTGDTTALWSFQEMQEWLIICRYYVDSGRRLSSVQDKVVRHAQRFGFLGVNIGRPSGWDAKYYTDKLLSTTPDDITLLQHCLENMQYQARHREEIARTCAERLDLPEELFRALRAIAHLSVCRLKLREALKFNTRSRDPLMSRIYEVIEGLVGEPLSEGLRRHLTIQEIEEALAMGVSPSVSTLRKRCTRCLLELRDSDIRVFSGAAALRRERQLHIPQCGNSRPKENLTGLSVGAAEIAVGQALVLVPKNTKFVSPLCGGKQAAGRIVITRTLHPDVIPACFYAAALVTEEGGLTSHAAVVAREFGTVCVVGVPGITEAVNTGEWVLVTGQTGRVRRISGAQAAKLLEVRADEELAEAGVHAVFPIHSSTRWHGPTLTVVDLGSPAASDATLVGRKAATLHQIHALTPPGFVITTVGVRRHLWLDVSRMPATSDPLPRELQVLLETHLASIGSAPIVVRSSHCNEGSATCSYAGVFKSFVGVDPGRSVDVSRAVRGVVASVSRPLATRYHQVRDIAEDLTGIAVIIQRMIEPVVSGICLSALFQGGRDWVLIEYISGPLAPLSSGQVRPLRTAIPRSVFRRRCRKEDLSHFLFPPGLEVMIGTSTVNELLARIAEVEQRLGGPHEIEWAADKDRVWILQARPLSHSRNLSRVQNAKGGEVP